MTEKQLHEKKLSEINYVTKIHIGGRKFTTPGYKLMAFDDLKEWAIAKAKERKCQNFDSEFKDCKDALQRNRWDGRWCPNCVIKDFLIRSFPLKEEDLNG